MHWGLIVLAAVVMTGLYVLGQMSPDVRFEAVGGETFSGDWFILAAAAILFGLMLFGPARAKTTPGRRWVLISLRLLVIILVLLTMLRPSLVHTTVRRQSATVIVLIDKSRSMTVKDDGDATRWETLEATLTTAMPELAQLAEALEFKFYSFDADLGVLDFNAGTGAATLGGPPAGDQTAIGWSLNDVLARESGKRLAAVILLSDGNQQAVAPRDRDATLAARRLATQEQPLHVVLLGRTDTQSQFRDASLESLKVNDTVHVKNRLIVEAEARLAGYAGRNVPVQLYFEQPGGEMKLVETKIVSTPDEGQSVPVEFTYVPQTPGDWRVTVQLPKQDGELDEDNNKRSTFVTVTKEGLSLVYLEGVPRPEQKFLRWSLGAAQGIEVFYARLNAREPDKRELPWPNPFARGEEPDDVFILGDIDSQGFKEGELEALRKRVEEGAGLIMLGGVHSFGPGGYDKTSLNDVLPVDMSGFQRQNFGEKIREDMHVKGPLTLRPAPDAEQQYLTRLADDPGQDAAAWAALPPLIDGANKLKPKSAATVLLEGVNPQGQATPILIAGNYGRGRVLAMAGDSTWRWFYGHEPEHKRFWRQVILWLARRDQVQEGAVWVNLDRRDVNHGGKVQITAGATSPQGAPLADAEFVARLKRPDGSQRLLTLNRSGPERKLTLAENDLAQPGVYEVSIEAAYNGEPLGTASKRFEVRPKEDLEMKRPIADFSAMQALAKLTGGVIVTPDKFAQILDLLRQVPAELEITETTRSGLWDALIEWRISRGTTLTLSLATLLATALAVLLGLEWFLRKRWGLV